MVKKKNVQIEDKISVGSKIKNLDEEINILEQSLMSSKEEIEKNKKETEKSKKEIERKNTEMKKVEKQINQLEQSLQRSKEQIEQSNEQMENIEKERTNLKEEVKQKDNEIKSLQKEVETHIEGNEKLTKEVGKLNALLEANEKVNQELTKTITDLRGQLPKQDTLVALPNPVLDLDLIKANRELGEVFSLCALKDGGALVYNEKYDDTAPVVRVDRGGEIVPPPCICKKDNSITGIIINKQQVYVIQEKGYITVCNIQYLSKIQAHHKIPGVGVAGNGVLIGDELILPDYKQNIIFRYNLKTKKKAKILSGLNGPSSVAYRNEGDVELYAVSEYGDCSITLYDEAWNKLVTFGSEDEGDEELDGPSCVIFSPTGSLLVADSDNDRISEFSQQGSFVRHVVTFDDDISRPQSLSYSNHQLWVGCEGGRNVKRFTLYKSE